jgi:hypothetical protein
MVVVLKGVLPTLSRSFAELAQNHRGDFTPQRQASLSRHEVDLNLMTTAIKTHGA